METSPEKEPEYKVYCPDCGKALNSRYTMHLCPVRNPFFPKDDRDG